MIDLELTRSAHDRRLYVLEGVGTLRLEGLFANRATATAADRSWELYTTGLLRRTIEAVDSAGTVAGRYHPKGGLSRGGTPVWEGRKFALEPSSLWRHRYALLEDGREQALITARSWGKRPVDISLTATIDPGLLLFGVFIVRSLAVASDGSAAAVSSATMSSMGASSG
jgi:hypothetical protein